MTLLPYKGQYKRTIQDYNLDRSHMSQADRLKIKKKAQKEMKSRMTGSDGKINWWKIIRYIGYIIAQLVVQWWADDFEDKPLEV